MSGKYYRLAYPLRRMWIDPLDLVRPPSRFFDQHLDRFWRSSLIPPEVQRMLFNANEFFRPIRAIEEVDDAVDSTVKFDKDKFQANVDVQMFKPEEISVKITGDTITIEGKHEEKEDKHGLISRHFVRKYVLPKGHDINKIESTLSSDGVLTITAPKIENKESEEESRSVPIMQTGEPAKAVEDKTKTEKTE